MINDKNFPAKVKVRGLVAWMAGERETERLETIDKAIQRKFSNLLEAKGIRTLLGEHLTRENILAEAAYLKQPNRQSFERPYG